MGKSGAKTSPTASKTSSSLPFGCFSSVFHLFDFSYFHFPSNYQTTTTASTTTAGTSSTSGCSCFRPELDSFVSPLKGAEAPRNSLESEDEVSTSTTSASVSASASVSLTSTSKEDDLNIPARIQIGTRNETSSEISSSPGTKTPTLVARLMGLDLLPESPSYNSSSTPNYQQLQKLKPLQISHRKSLDGDIRGRTGTRSLPDTPRISSARRSESDVDIHRHRLSLHINKENMSPSEEVVVSRLKGLRKKELKHEEIQENRSPSHYARMIVKQVKESVGRKLGTDITNTVRNRESSNQHSRASTKLDDHSKPRIFLDSNKSKPMVIDSSIKEQDTRIQARPIRVLAKPNLQRVKEEQDEHQKQQNVPKASSKYKKIMSGEKFGSSRSKRPQRTSDIIRNKQEEPFVRPFTDKKCKKTPLSNDLLNISVPNLLPVKKDHSLPPTKIPQKQVLAAQKPKRCSQLSSCSSQMYDNNKQESAMSIRFDRDDKNDVDQSTTGDAEAEHEYIDRILRRIGLNKSTPLSYISWFSPSHPLDPSIFYYLEHFTTCSTQLRHRCNRKLMFHLVDEILTEVLKPCFDLKPRVGFVGMGHDFRRMNGLELMEILCSRIRRFPRANCRVLEDIDGLIEKDLEMKDQIVMAYEEEGEGIVGEIEKEIIEGLMNETASDFVVRI